MKSTKFLRALPVSLVLFAAGCATAPQEDPVLIKLTELENRLVAIERVVNNQSLLSQQTELDQMSSELRSLRGTVETLQFENQGAGKRQRDQYVDLDGRLQKLEQGRAAFPSVGGANSPLAAGDERANYEAAFDLLKTGRYDDAKVAFGQFLQNHSQSAFADNANYWLAEAHYVTGDFPSALTQFQQVIALYPGSAKVPDAWLKVGYCQYELESYPEARASLESVVAGYPDTTPARLAAQRLQQMAGEGR